MKNKNFSKNNLKKTKKAFTLIEALVALFVFSILVTAVSAIYVNFLDAQVYARNTQIRLENLQLASNLIAKTTRTSELVSPDDTDPEGFTKEIRIFDYSRPAEIACLNFKVDDAGALRFYTITLPPLSTVVNCELAAVPVLTDWVRLTDDQYYVDGGFYFRHTDPGVNQGLMVVSLWACESGSSCSGIEGNTTRVQSSVSMKRD